MYTAIQQPTKLSDIGYSGHHPKSLVFLEQKICRKI